MPVATDFAENIYMYRLVFICPHCVRVNMMLKRVCHLPLLALTAYLNISSAPFVDISLHPLITLITFLNFKSEMHWHNTAEVEPDFLPQRSLFTVPS